MCMSARDIRSHAIVIISLVVYGISGRIGLDCRDRVFGKQHSYDHQLMMSICRAQNHSLATSDGGNRKVARGHPGCGIIPCLNWHSLLLVDFAGGGPAVCQDCVHRAGGGLRDAAWLAPRCSGACSQVCTHHETGKTPCLLHHAYHDTTCSLTYGGFWTPRLQM